VRGAEGDCEEALEDLDRAAEEAMRGGMDLLYADALLQRSACYLSRFRLMSLSETRAVETQFGRTFAEAKRHVESIGYGRRQGMIQELEAAAQSLGVMA
jgi:hypothetical protein